MIAKDLNNRRFGRLVALEPTNKRIDGFIVWKCICDCGNLTDQTVGHLVSGHTRSCGCLRVDTSRERRIQEQGEASCSYLFTQYKRNSKERNIEFGLTREQFKSITSSNCYYCGLEPLQVRYLVKSNGAYLYNGIDRIDNTKGYTTDNCVPCCKSCNFAKRNLTLSEFKSWIERIYLRIDLWNHPSPS